MRILFFLLVFLNFTVISFAQSMSNMVIIDKIDQILYYDYRFCEFAGNTASVKMIPMQLQIGAQGSKFCSTKKADADSLCVAHEQMPIEQAFGIIWPQLMNMQSHFYVHYYVFKHYPERGKMQFLESHNKNRYLVEEDIQFDWQIYPERDTTIIDLHCLMATATYGGRDYVAWFAPDIPISDGPYKFCGLPGIIVRIADTENEHIFELQGARYNVNQPMYYSTTPATRVSPKGYVKAFYEHMAENIDELQDYMPDPGHRAKAIRRLKNINNLIERY